MPHTFPNLPLNLSIVIPVYNEATGLANTVDEVVEAVSDLTEHYEIIVVDDGSSDDTYQRLRQVRQMNTRVKGIRLSRHFGKEAALLAGMRRASGDAVVTMDGDLQHPPALIREMYAAWKQGAHVVHGVKRDTLAKSRVYRWASTTFNRLFSWLAGFDITDSSDFKLLDADVVRVLVTRFPEHTRFYRGLSTWVGYEQTTLTFDVQERVSGRSRWHWYGLLRYAWNTITAYSSMPLKIVPLLGIVMLFVSVVLGAEALVSRLSGNAVSGFATLEITILFTGSVIMIGLGIIGQYLARIYDELKARPSYLIAEEDGLDQ